MLDSHHNESIDLCKQLIDLLHLNLSGVCVQQRVKSDFGLGWHQWSLLSNQPLDRRCRHLLMNILTAVFLLKLLYLTRSQNVIIYDLLNSWRLWLHHYPLDLLNFHG